jgi:IclR family transcriptional regulator, acetate operon repressor
MLRVRESKSAPVGVVTKVLRILETLQDSSAPLQLKEISLRTNINKSTAYRFLAHLESEGYLFRDDAGAYIVGPKLARLGSGAAYHATLRTVSRPVMQRLSLVTTETVNLGVLSGLDVLYVDVLESTHLFRMASQIGSRLPLHCTALGKAMLASLGPAERDGAMASLRLEKVAPHTITSVARLQKELKKIAQQGYAVDDEEASAGARCVGAPIFDHSGNVAAALSVSGPITRIAREKLLAIGKGVREGAQLISRNLGYKAAKTTAAPAVETHPGPLSPR